MQTRHYCNQRPQLIILRCIGADHFFLEKVLFPWEDWCFACPEDSRVEIWTHGLSGVELEDAIDSQELSLRFAVSA
jgi:hypothetical protein